MPSRSPIMMSCNSKKQQNTGGALGNIRVLNKVASNDDMASQAGSAPLPRWPCI